MDLLDLLQWPAMAATLIATWLVASSNQNKRHAGFWVFLLSNGLWMAWAWSAHAPAVAAMQVCLAAMNIRGTWKTESQQSETIRT